MQSRKADKTGSQAKGTPEQLHRPSRLRLAAVGMEAEFTLVVDGREVKPEALFADPRAFIRGALMHREGTSYHLPTGGAVYFDTGVIEVATPVIEIDRGCAARAGRSLWEALRFIRTELDAWEARTGRHARLVGFSTHYNISFELSPAAQGRRRTVRRLAELLAYLLPPPVMLLATNRRSTGVGVRPRGDRIEVTVDFTPSASLMIATGTVVTSIVRAVMAWPSFEHAMLAEAGLPVLRGFTPVPHTTRQGWLAHVDSYPRNPFTEDVDRPCWEVEPAFFARTGQPARPLSLREVSLQTVQHFRPALRRLADPFTYRLIQSVLRGQAPSLLDLPDRPEAYEDAGRLCVWDDLFPDSILSRSRYERVLIRAISGHQLHLHGRRYIPVGMRGWSEVVFREPGDGRRHYFPIDLLVNHLDDWEQQDPPPTP